VSGPGPTYAEMQDPRRLPDAVRVRLSDARVRELDPLNLFNITWRRPDGSINHLVLPHEMTGVDANIIVLLGKDFPSGSHKVGPVYTTLMEADWTSGSRPPPRQWSLLRPATSASVPRTWGPSKAIG